MPIWKRAPDRAGPSRNGLVGPNVDWLSGWGIYSLSDTDKIGSVTFENFGSFRAFLLGTEDVRPPREHAAMTVRRAYRSMVRVVDITLRNIESHPPATLLRDLRAFVPSWWKIADRRPEAA